MYIKKIKWKIEIKEYQEKIYLFLATPGNLMEHNKNLFMLLDDWIHSRLG